MPNPIPLGEMSFFWQPLQMKNKTELRLSGGTRCLRNGRFSNGGQIGRSSRGKNKYCSTCGITLGWFNHPKTCVCCKGTACHECSRQVTAYLYQPGGTSTSAKVMSVRKMVCKRPCHQALVLDDAMVAITSRIASFGVTDSTLTPLEANRGRRPKLRQSRRPAATQIDWRKIFCLGQSPQPPPKQPPSHQKKQPGVSMIPITTMEAASMTYRELAAAALRNHAECARQRFPVEDIDSPATKSAPVVSPAVARISMIKVRVVKTLERASFNAGRVKVARWRGGKLETTPEDGEEMAASWVTSAQSSDLFHEEAER